MDLSFAVGSTIGLIIGNMVLHMLVFNETLPVAAAIGVLAGFIYAGCLWLFFSFRTWQKNR